MVDTIDEVILSTLSTNSKQDTKEIWNFLMDYDYNLTDEEIESRIGKLERNGVITRYNISIDMQKINRRTTRVLLKIQKIAASFK
jgi:Lrp/AsnC family leucine-responsive transcriptional regulator